MNANQIGQKKKKQALRRLSSSGQNARKGDIRRMLELRKNASNSQGRFRRIKPSNHGEALHEKRTNIFGSVARSNEQFPTKPNSQRHISPLVKESFSKHLESDVVTGSTSINTRGNVFGGLQTNASVYQSTSTIGSGSSTNMKNTNVESSLGSMNNSGPQNFGVFTSKQYEDQSYLKNFLSSSAPVTTIKENDVTSHVTGSNMFSRAVQPAIANNQGSNASIFNSQLESQTPIFGNTDKPLNSTSMMKPSSQNSEFLKISSNSNLGSSIFGISPSLSDVSKNLHVSSLKNNVFGNFENLQSTSSVTIPGIPSSFKMSSNTPEISNLHATSTVADSTLLQASTSSNSREIFTKTSFNDKSGNLSSKTNEIFTSNAITHKPQTNVFSSSIANEKRSSSSVSEDKRNNGKELQIIGPHFQFANSEGVCSEAAPSVLNTKFSGIFSQSRKSSVDSKLTFGNVDYSDSSTNISGRDISSTKVEHESTMFSNSQSVNDNKKAVSTTFDRTLSGREISDLTSIVIKGLSSRFFDKKTLQKELKKFGPCKVSLQPSKGNVIVDFDSHERAGSVKGALTEIFPHENLHVFWCKKKGTRRISRTLEKANHDMTEIRSRKLSITNALNSIDVGEFPPALSATERYNILDEVDKKIREAITPYKDIKNAPVVVGVCCDMCPEKERYMRESQANLSIFEMIPETHEYRDGDVPKVDHRRAVKEYSRSAADKLEPLAHELRPVNVLHRTLDYLMCHVMNYNGDKWGEWFNFLWNRTRAIRKDVTQQHLCDEKSAELVEKITRFHIFCSHYLCEEDIHSFDPKINNENLTKCLQTLKQIYTDLYSEQGIKCENEAEFQAYDILLNLNEGDSLRKAMQYRVEIRDSPEVKFSLEVFSSVNTHNYIRFFKLLQSTSYLNACVMHRYFNQVRAMALKIMTKAYSANEMYPLQVLKDVLSFEDIDEVTRFCNHFNFTLIQDALRFSKTLFVEPEMAFPSQRSMNGIESKRYCSISEIVNGSPLPVCSIHQPVSSFDSNNRYIGLNNLLALMQNTPDTPDILHDIHEPTSNLSSVQPCPISQYFVKDAQDVFNQAAEDVMLALLNNVVYDMVKNVYEEETREVFLMKQITKSFMETFLIESIHELLSVLAEETIEKEGENVRVSRDRMTSIVRDELLNDVIKVELKNVAVQTMSDISDQMWTQSFTKMSAVVMQEIIAKMICEQCQIIATYVREDAVKKMKDELKKKEELFRKKKTAKYLEIWRKEYKTRLYIRSVLQDLPPRSPLLSLRQQIKKLFNVEERGEGLGYPLYDISSLKDRVNVEKLLSRKTNENVVKRVKTIQPIDLEKLNKQRKMNAKQDTLPPVDCVKLLISFPYNVDDLSTSDICSLIRCKFHDSTSSSRSTLPKGLESKLEQLSLKNDNDGLNYSIKASYGLLSNVELDEVINKRVLFGLTGVILIVDSCEHAKDKTKFWRKCRARLEQILRGKPSIPGLPLVIINIVSVHSLEDDVQDYLDIESFRRQHLLSHTKVYSIHVDSEPEYCHKQLLEVVQWMLFYSPTFSSIKKDTLKNILEKEITKHFMIPFCHENIRRKSCHLEPQCPEVLVELYNAVLDHVIAMITNSQLKNISWPITEFVDRNISCNNFAAFLSWNSPQTLRLLESFIEKLKLPTPPSAAQDGTWSSEYILCLHYIDLLLKSEPLKKYEYVLNNRIEKIFKPFVMSSRDTSSLRVFSPTYNLRAADLPWTEIIEACVETMLSSLHNFPRINIYFLSESLNDFKPPPSWIVATNESFESITTYDRSKSLLNDFTDAVNDDLSKIENTRLKSTIRKSYSDDDDVKSKTCCLEKTLLSEKNSSRRFERELRSILDEDISSSLNTRGQGLKRKIPNLKHEKRNVKKNTSFDVLDDLTHINRTLSEFETTIISLRDSVRFQNQVEGFGERQLLEALEDSIDDLNHTK